MNKFILNGFEILSVSNDTIIRKTEGFEMTPSISSFNEVSGRPGGVYGGGKASIRTMVIEGDLVGPNIYANRRLMQKHLKVSPSLLPMSFITYDNLELYCQFQVVGLEFEYTSQIHTFLLTLRAPDPYFYSAPKISLFGVTTQGGGSPIPTPIPMSFVNEGAASPPVVNNEGNVSTIPSLEITGPGSDFVIMNTTNGDQIIANVELDIGEVLFINPKNRTASVGLLNVYNNIEWGLDFELDPGVNSQYFDGLGTSDGTELKITYSDAYNGL